MSDIGEIRLGPLGSMYDLTIAAQELADKENEVIRALLELAVRKITWDDVDEKPEVFPPDLSEIPSAGNGQALNSVLWVNVEDVPTNLEGFRLLEEVRNIALARIADGIGTHNADETNVHGIDDTGQLETLAGAQAKVVAGIAQHLVDIDHLTTAEANALYSQLGHSHAWGDITSGVPSSFVPSAHNHNASDINTGTLADARVSANIAKYNGTLPFTGALNGAAAGAYPGVFGAQGGIRLTDGSTGWTIYAGSGSMYLENDDGTAFAELSPVGVWDRASLPVELTYEDEENTFLRNQNVRNDTTASDTRLRVLVNAGRVGSLDFHDGTTSAAVRLGRFQAVPASNYFGFQAGKDAAGDRMAFRVFTLSAADVDTTGLYIGAGADASNVSLCGIASWGGGVKIVYIPIAGTIPSSNPTSGFFLYGDPADNKLKVRGPSGTITVLANP